jgi:outer membrane protein insertion porin family
MHLHLYRLSILLFLSITQVFAQNAGERDSSAQTMAYEHPQLYYIAEISVKGAENLNAEIIKTLSGLEERERIQIPGPEISQAIHRIWAQHIVEDITVEATKFEKDRVWLQISIKELPRLVSMDLEGVKKTQEKELASRINFVRGKTLKVADYNRIRSVIQKYFAEKGYFNAEVNIEKKKDQFLENHVHLTVNINPGQKVKISEINFEGNQAISAGRLKKQFENTHEKSIFNIFRSSKYIPSHLEKDKQLVLNYYRSKGFLDAEFTEEAIIKKDNGDVQINLQVEEGKPYYIRNITWTGNYVYDDKTLQKVLDIKEGELYNPQKVEENLFFNPNQADVSSLYLDNGYLFFSVESAEIRVAGDSIDLEMRIREGEQATISEVTVSGNNLTKDHVILREIRTVPGDKFSRAELIRSQREIAQLGFFDPNQIGINPIPHPEDGTVDINYSVVEQPSDRIELSGGWGGSYGFIGTLGLTLNNFSIKDIPNLSRWQPYPVGGGQKLGIRFQANGKDFHSYSLTFSEPWLGGTKPQTLSTGISRAQQRRQFAFIDANGNEQIRTGTLKLTTATASFSKRLKWPDDYFSLTNSFSYSLYELEDYESALGFSTGTSNNFLFNTTLARNSLDHPIYPTKGSSIALSVSVTPPYSLFNDKDYTTLDNAEKYKWSEYYKGMLDIRQYLNPFGKLVLEGRAHLGLIGAYSERKGVGPFERFYMGGSGLGGQNFLLGNDLVGLRGYPDNSLVPNDDVTGIEGGVTFNKFALEVRHPIFMKPAATLYVHSFAEAGNNWNHMQDFSLNNLYKSAGVGARIHMPAFGLIGIDWGYGFDPLPGTTTPSGWNFHFTIGTQIR